MITVTPRIVGDMPGLGVTAASKSRKIAMDLGNH
jgi:hypothetical protein